MRSCAVTHTVFIKYLWVEFKGRQTVTKVLSLIPCLCVFLGHF